MTQPMYQLLPQGSHPAMEEDSWTLRTKSNKNVIPQLIDSEVTARLLSLYDV